MAKPPALVVSALATWNGKALTKGKKQISEFDKSAQKLGKTFAKVFGSVALVSFGKNAVNAFIDSEKAAAKLRTTVSNLGLAFEQPGIDKYLDKLSLQFGIVDENLIPGFQRLLIATKDVAQAQSLFETALNVSAGTGKDLTAVSTSLSKAYLGDNAALGTLGVGLTKTQLKSASFLELQNTLNANFAGQAAAAVEGYAGSMAKLTVAVDKSKEAIGKGLLDALAALSASKDIDTFTAKMVRSAEKIGSSFATLGDVIGLLNPNASIKVGNKFVRRSDVMNQNQGGYSGIPSQRKAETKAIKDAVTLRKQENTLIKAKTAVDQLRDKFDVERIGLTAALNAAVDEETKLRLRAQLAILDNNEALSKKILAELAAADAAKKFAENFTFALDSVKTMTAKINAFIASMGVTPPSTSAAPTYSYALSTAQATNEKIAAFENKIAIDSTRELNSRISEFLSQNNAQRSSSQAPMDIKVTVDAGGDRLSQAIAESIQVATRSGYSTVPAGFIA